MKNRLRRVGTSVLLLSATQPAWALGDSVIPQTAGLIVGGPALMALFIGLIAAATRGDKTIPASQKRWGRVAFWGILFNSLLLCLLFVFDPATWNMSAGWSQTTFLESYLIPTAALATFLLCKGRARRAAVVTVSCLLVGISYLLWIMIRMAMAGY